MYISHNLLMFHIMLGNELMIHCILVLLLLRALNMVKGASIFKTTIYVQRKKTQFCSLKV